MQKISLNRQSEVKSGLFPGFAKSGETISGSNTGPDFGEGDNPSRDLFKTKADVVKFVQEAVANEANALCAAFRSALVWVGRSCRDALVWRGHFVTQLDNQSGPATVSCIRSSL